MSLLRCAALLGLLSASACAAAPAVTSADGDARDAQASGGSSKEAVDGEVKVRLAGERRDAPSDKKEEKKPDEQPGAPDLLEEDNQQLGGDHPDDAGAPPPPPPPPPPPDKVIVAGPHGKATLHAATADSAGGRIDSSAIRDVIAKNVAQFRPCLRADLALRVEATISPSGDVLEARSPRSFPDDAKARDCVMMAVKRLHFERFEASSPARVTFELALKKTVDY